MGLDDMTVRDRQAWIMRGTVGVIVALVAAGIVGTLTLANNVTALGGQVQLERQINVQQAKEIEEAKAIARLIQKDLSDIKADIRGIHVLLQARKAEKAAEENAVAGGL